MNKQKAFSLIEVVLAVGVLGVALSVLIGVVTPLIGGLRTVATQEAALAALPEVKRALQENLSPNEIKGFEVSMYDSKDPRVKLVEMKKDGASYSFPYVITPHES